MKYYNTKEISKEGANFNIIIGERGNGKSYDLKHEKAVKRYLYDTEEYFINPIKPTEVIKKVIKKGSRFILLRRWKEEITSDNIIQYFQDINVAELTDGIFNKIIYYRKSLYFGKINYETGIEKKYDLIGYVRALSVEQNYAGSSFLDVTDIIFEEFISRSAYLANEPAKFMNFYSTVDRKRGTTKAWLCGNTISEIFPYREEWELDSLFKEIKQGQIKSKLLSTGNHDDLGNTIFVKIAVEYCQSTGTTSFAIGRHKDMLNKGSWQVDPQPKLSKNYKDMMLLLRFGFDYKNNKFICDYLLDHDTNSTIFFIYPYKKDNFKKNTIIFSDIINVSSYYQRDIYNISIKNKKLDLIFKSFKENKIFYSSDKCGTDFKQAIDFTIKK